MSIHLKNLKKGLLGEVTLIVGDPSRVHLISSEWKNTETIVDSREFLLVAGEYKERKVSICSTGIGAGSTEIAVTELIENGVKKIIRAGGCGAWTDGINPGDIILNSAMARSQGMMSAYVPESYPASADPILLSAIHKKMKKAQINVHVGIGLTSETYYMGQGRRPEIENALSIDKNYISYWSQRGILNCEMESAILFILGNIYGIPVANSLVVHVSRKNEKWTKEEDYKKRHKEASMIVLDAALDIE